MLREDVEGSFGMVFGAIHDEFLSLGRALEVYGRLIRWLRGSS